ncbi:YmdB family metallophosphoesterase [Candidatus Parcubacteria bacterium]|nr:YmdB family metallophosphoesterase [Patescibacteria group bacterium]MBU4380599.1 YmdB family metallophosphoesterase [Patescibacteria group bacterium]MCG2689527.1 YmdB family metallophosphoesterase [Candidatus Parcubacteria bacterium]
MIKVLFIGDIVGSLGRSTLQKVLPRLIVSDNINLVVANCDNLAHGRGATEQTIKETMGYGVDVFTGGDHIFDLKEFQNEIANLPVARAQNFLGDIPGMGYQLIKKGFRYPFCVISLMGECFGGQNISNPFYAVSDLLRGLKRKKLSGILVDIHGDLTSQKVAMGHFLDGKVSAVVGTHTHIPTCDERILDKGTAFVTDAGMVGAQDSVLGVKKEIIISRFLDSLPHKFEWATEEPAVFNSVLITVDEKTGLATSIERKDIILKGGDPK